MRREGYQILRPGFRRKWPGIPSEAKNPAGPILISPFLGEIRVGILTFAPAFAKR
jgi:hypothetical protein